MGTKERKEREKRQRRNSIIDSAEKVFFSKGLSQATMDEVAIEAEVSKGTLYLYFNSKEDLYLAIVSRAQEVLCELFEKAVKKPKKGLEKVRALGKEYFRFYEKYTHYFEALLYFEKNYPYDPKDPNLNSIQCKEVHEKILAVLIQALQIGIEDGSIRKNIDPFKTALILWAKSVGVIQLISLKGNSICERHNITPEDLLDTFFEFIDYALSPK